MRNFITIILIIANFLFAGYVGTTGANYLKIGLGAKAPAMGENFAALANDSSAVYWNPSGITQAKSQQFDFMQMDWIAGISSKTFSGIYPLSETDFIGAYVFMLDTPFDKETIYDTAALNEYSETGDKFKNSASVIDIAYSKIISEKLSAGVGVKNIHEELAGTKANGFALDAGLLYKEFYPNLNLGLAVQNIAVNKLRADEDYPMTITLGTSYALKFYDRPLTLLSDIKIPNDNDVRYGVGAEYWLAEIFALRGGYNSLYKFTFGVGIKLQNLTADYAYVPVGDLGVTHRISVGYKFDAIEEKKEIKPEEAKPVKEEDIQSLFEEKKPQSVTPAAEMLFPEVTENTVPVMEEKPVTPNTEPVKTEPVGSTGNQEVNNTFSEL